VPSTLIDLLLLVIGGAIGGTAAGAAIKEYSAGILTNAIAGAIGGGIGGYVLNEFIPAMVDLNGNPHFAESLFEQAAIRALAGFIAGGIVAMIFTFLKILKTEREPK
jgi:hypothetical protein